MFAAWGNFNGGSLERKCETTVGLHREKYSPLDRDKAEKIKNVEGVENQKGEAGERWIRG